MDVGAQIEHYKVIEHIGRGGMADVWSARDESLGRMVAIKTIVRNLSAQKDPIALFEREAKTIANLEHPHILPIYGFGEYEGKLYIVMRFVTGGSLEGVINQGAMSPKAAVHTGRAVADALEHAHSENIVHLDLKPPNILLDSKSAPYLADFGLAAVLGPEGRARNPGSGTLLYMAPEQLTSDELDHRADVYSFSLMLFHMLTGSLPFDAMIPLALKQLQFQDNLPSLHDLNPDLPGDLTDILRKGTAPDPKRRYNSAAQVITDVETAFGLGAAASEARGHSSPFVEMVSLFNPKQANLREAQDIYERARAAWANGSGRFLLSVTHFMVMSDYYAEAQKHNLSYDDAGAQMLLRGALEYNYHPETWWEKCNNDARRWVCLHTIRSESPQARIRAFYRLETLPDTDPPTIPTQVAQALSIENDESAILAALEVLAFRGKLVAGRSDYNVKSEFRGRILTTIAREGLQLTADSQWQNVTYSQEIDVLIAEIALNTDSPTVREAAARTIGKMRSVRAVRCIVDAHKRGSPKALNALAHVLDEVPQLPGSTETVPRLLAWLLNTWWRLTNAPMQTVTAFVFALVGGWLGMGQHIFRTWRFPQSFFDSQRVLNTAAGGLFMGFLWSLLTVMALTLPQRLRGFWPNWTRALWSGLAGFYLAQTLWWAYGWMYLNLNDVPRSIIAVTGLGTALGLFVPALVQMRGWVAVLLTVVATYIPLYVGTLNYYRLYMLGTDPLFGISPDYAAFGWILAYDKASQVWTVMLPLVLLFALGAHFPAVLADLRDLLRWARPAILPKARPSRHRASVEGQPTQHLNRPFPLSQAETADIQEIPAVSDSPLVPVPPASDEDITRPDRDTMLKTEEPTTEEFEMDRVGGAGDGDDDAARIQKEVAKDWQSITDQLNDLVSDGSNNNDDDDDDG